MVFDGLSSAGDDRLGGCRYRQQQAAGLISWAWVSLHPGRRWRELLPWCGGSLGPPGLNIVINGMTERCRRSFCHS